jgi:uncharacterized protein (DUF983 family)
MLRRHGHDHPEFAIASVPPMIRRARQFVRAVRLRCPLCGTRWPRPGAIRFVRQCPVCDLDLERHEHDFFLGAYTLNLFATLLVTVAIVFANVFWSGVPMPLRYGASLLAIAGFAFWFYPCSKLLWLAVDLQFRNAEEKDFDDPSE